MTANSQYTYPSPLQGYEHLPPLSDERNDDGKSFANPTTNVLSEAYEKFVDPIKKGFDIHIYFFQVRKGNSPRYFKANTIVLAVYHTTRRPPAAPSPFNLTEPQGNKAQVTFAHELWTRIRHEFPELRIYRVWDRPLGPHPVGMFEVDVSTPAQFGAFVAWLVINRGPLSALVHPHTGDAEVSASSLAAPFWASLTADLGLMGMLQRDHGQRATWLGDRLPLDFDLIRTLA